MRNAGSMRRNPSTLSYSASKEVKGLPSLFKREVVSPKTLYEGGAGVARSNTNAFVIEEDFNSMITLLYHYPSFCSLNDLCRTETEPGQLFTVNF